MKSLGRSVKSNKCTCPNRSTPSKTSCEDGTKIFMNKNTVSLSFPFCDVRIDGRVDFYSYQQISSFVSSFQLNSKRQEDAVVSPSNSECLHQCGAKVRGSLSLWVTRGRGGGSVAGETVSVVWDRRVPAMAPTTAFLVEPRRMQTKKQRAGLIWVTPL